MVRFIWLLYQITPVEYIYTRYDEIRVGNILPHLPPCTTKMAVLFI